jgi:hyperosmotically inducible periplasmic protein
VARFLLKTVDKDSRTDMRKKPYIESRLLIAAALALPVFAFTAGCKSTPTPPAPSAAPAAETVNDDATLAARVKAAIVADPELRTLPMSVATYRGVVQLSGYVDSEAQMQKALAVTRGVPGVQSVSNDLHPRPK